MTKYFLIILTSLLQLLASGQKDSSYCIRIPNLLFEKNSVKPYWDTTDIIWGKKTFEHGINYYKKILQDNPNIIIKLYGFRDSTERILNRLPKRRAVYIKKLLLTKQINRKRIKTSGKGVNNEEYYYDKTPTDKLLYNRRVNFLIISFDYKKT